MATSFVTARFPEQEMARHSDRMGMLSRTRGFLRPAEEARIREAGVSKYNRWQRAERVFEIVKDRTARQGVGPKLIIQRRTPNLDELSIREVDDHPTIPDLNAHPGIEKSHALTYEKFRGKLRSGGIWYCRYVDGTHTVSKHGFLAPTWKGAAEDTFVTEGGMAFQTQVANWKIEQTKKGVLNLATVICDDWIWTPQGGKRAYGGVRHFHIHEDCSGGRACNP